MVLFQSKFTVNNSKNSFSNVTRYSCSNKLYKLIIDVNNKVYDINIGSKIQLLISDNIDNDYEYITSGIVCDMSDDKLDVYISSGGLLTIIHNIKNNVKFSKGQKLYIHIITINEVKL